MKLTARGRNSGKPRRVTIWISTDGEHLYVRSGGGMKRDWPQNLVAAGEAELQVAATKLRVRARHVTESGEARTVSELARAKYGAQIRPSQSPGPLTPGETATFELLPVD